MPGDNDYPLKVGMVVFTDQTTTDVKKLTIRFELVLYEKGVIEGVSLSETRRVGKRGQSTNLDRLWKIGGLKGWRDKSESSLRERCTMSWREVIAERALSGATRIAGCSLRPSVKLAKRPDGLLMRGF